MESSNTIQIGDQTYTVGKFSTFKALRAGKLVSRILNKIPDLQDHVNEFIRDYREKNSQKISRADAELRWPKEQVERVSEAAWESSEGYITLAPTPTQYEIAAHVFPTVFEAAEDEVLTLLALLVTSNPELRAADEGDRVDAALEEKRKMLVHEDLSDLLDLVAIAGEVLNEQFAGKADRLRRMGRLFNRSITEGGEESSPNGDQTPNGTTPSSSIDSPTPTGGDMTRSSIESPSEPSAAASS